MSNGHNPMRWDCDKRGCFNKKRRPKIEVFHDLFPGRISFGDVDAIVEINGHALILEWKSERNDPATGQRIMYERLTANAPITVMLVVGDAETMEIDSLGYFFAGKYSAPVDCDLNGMREKIAGWVKYAGGNKATPIRAIKAKIAEIANLAGLSVGGA